MKVVDRTVTIGSDVFAYKVMESSRNRARLVVRPTGDVEVRVPEGTSDSWIADFVRRRARWIIRQRDYFDAFRPHDPPCQYQNGETLRYLGRQYRLKLVKGTEESAKLWGRHLIVTTPDLQREVVRELVHHWFRSHAETAIRRRVDECMHLVARHGVARPPIQFRSMKRRWGSCSARGRILLNPDLAIAPSDCIDYVIIHELCHLKHSCHDRAFYQLLTTVMPDWQRRKERLDGVGRHLGKGSGIGCA